MRGFFCGHRSPKRADLLQPFNTVATGFLSLSGGETTSSAQKIKVFLLVSAVPEPCSVLGLSLTLTPIDSEQLAS